KTVTLPFSDGKPAVAPIEFRAAVTEVVSAGGLTTVGLLNGGALPASGLVVWFETAPLNDSFQVLLPFRSIRWTSLPNPWAVVPLSSLRTTVCKPKFTLAFSNRSTFVFVRPPTKSMSYTVGSIGLLAQTFVLFRPKMLFIAV